MRWTRSRGLRRLEFRFVTPEFVSRGSMNADNGLREDCDLMADKIMAVSRSKLGRRIGAVSAEEMNRVENAMLLVLGFAG